MAETERWSRLIATWFGCGRSPIAPGTVGTLGALPLHFLLRRLGPVPYLCSVATVTAIGLWASEREAARLGDEDPQSVVIDEVAGVLLALALVNGRGWKAEAAAVALFRLFDIWKPGLVDRVQHAKPPGLGIMLDDLAAGLMAGLSARWLFLGRS
jgi:phosphatidylglycerophosphatase A